MKPLKTWQAIALFIVGTFALLWAPSLFSGRCRDFCLSIISLWDGLKHSWEMILALATAALAFYTAKLWKATVALGAETKATADNALKIARDDFVQTNRPWVSGDFVLRRMIGRNDAHEIWIDLALKNTGKGPALGVFVSYE